MCPRSEPACRPRKPRGDRRCATHRVLFLRRVRLRARLRAPISYPDSRVVRHAPDRSAYWPPPLLLGTLLRSTGRCISDRSCASFKFRAEQEDLLIAEHQTKSAEPAAMDRGVYRPQRRLQEDLGGFCEG